MPISVVAELGSGSGKKTQRILEALTSLQHDVNTLRSMFPANPFRTAAIPQQRSVVFNVTFAVVVSRRACEGADRAGPLAEACCSCFWAAVSETFQKTRFACF